ncbi:MAG TPA: SDR family oxidoreductase [Ilumatobacteraceae bacterium]|nr:SDR family oxidoreductase [Ilumatobacteraceae bacterium]
MARILITGSNSGFGKLAALSFARQGHGVIATMRTLEKGDDLRARVDAEGLPIEIRRLDVTDPASVAEGIGDPSEIDVVVNNAGFEVWGALELIDDELWTRQLDTNVLGLMRVIRHVLPAWRERASGTIVNVSSIAGIVGSPFGGAYAASKHALEGLSEALHFETAGFGIRVRLVEPGSFETDFRTNVVTVDGWDDSDYVERAERFRESRGALSGDGPPADPQDVADAIVRAALDPDAPFRNFVGDDAQLIHSVKSSMSFEEFEAVMRDTLDWHE